VAIDGRLEWREWETQEGVKRQAVEIVADSVQFLGGRDESSGGPSNGFTARSDIPVETGDFVAAPAGSASDDDIPF
jgi:single-strand DNA-binding protein